MAVTNSAVHGAAVSVVAGEGLRWHRFFRCDADIDMLPAVQYLSDRARSHGHEYVAMRSFFDAVDELEVVKNRLATIRERAVRTAAEAGFPEKHLLLPISVIGMFEGEVLELSRVAPSAGIRIVYIGTRERFDSMPYMLCAAVNLDADLCGCDSGF